MENKNEFIGQLQDEGFTKKSAKMLFEHLEKLNSFKEDYNAKHIYAEYTSIHDLFFNCDNFNFECMGFDNLTPIEVEQREQEIVDNLKDYTEVLDNGAGGYIIKLT